MLLDSQKPVLSAPFTTVKAWVSLFTRRDHSVLSKVWLVFWLVFIAVSFFYVTSSLVKHQEINMSMTLKLLEF